MKRAFIGILLLSLVAPAVQALTLSPDIVFTLRDEFPPLDGIADFSSTGPSGFTGFITNVDFIDETFFEYAVGSEIVASATLSIGAVIYDPLGTNMTMDVSSYNNGTGAVQFGLFGTGDYLATVPLTEFFTLNTIVLDISALYNNAVAANDDFLGFRLHNAIAIDGNIPQARYADSSLELSAIPLPAAAWLFATALIGLIGFNHRRSQATRAHIGAWQR